MMGVRIVVGEGEPIGHAMKRLRKKLDQNGILYEMRRRQCFLDGTQVRRAKEFKKRYRSRLATRLAKSEGLQ